MDKKQIISKLKQGWKWGIISRWGNEWYLERETGERFQFGLGLSRERVGTYGSELEARSAAPALKTLLHNHI